MRGIILGSSSKSRQLILTELGLEFSTISANIDEKAIGNRSLGSSPTELVLQIARAKADHLIANNLISPEMRSSILLTADTVVVHRNQVIEKPTTASEYMENMKSYATAPCSLVSGVVATDLMNGKQLEGVDTATLHFSAIPDSAVADLLAEGKIFHCAGGIMVENPLMRPYITNIEGSEDTVKGLSKALVQSLLDNLNLRNNS